MDVDARVAIPLLKYAPITQNARVAALRTTCDEDERSYSRDIAIDGDNLKTVIESAYRQIYFHAFASDRDANLESQLAGEITVRDFVRGLSRTLQAQLQPEQQLQVVRHLVQPARTRPAVQRSRRLIVIATKGVEKWSMSC